MWAALMRIDDGATHLAKWTSSRSACERRACLKAWHLTMLRGFIASGAVRSQPAAWFSEPKELTAVAAQVVKMDGIGGVVLGELAPGRHPQSVRAAAVKDCAHQIISRALTSCCMVCPRLWLYTENIGVRSSTEWARTSARLGCDVRWSRTKPDLVLVLVDSADHVQFYEFLHEHLV